MLLKKVFREIFGSVVVSLAHRNKANGVTEAKRDVIWCANLG